MISTILHMFEIFSSQKLIYYQIRLIVVTFFKKNRLMGHLIIYRRVSSSFNTLYIRLYSLKSVLWKWYRILSHALWRSMKNKTLTTDYIHQPNKNGIAMTINLLVDRPYQSSYIFITPHTIVIFIGSIES